MNRDIDVVNELIQKGVDILAPQSVYIAPCQDQIVTVVHKENAAHLISDSGTSSGNDCYHVSS